MNTTADYDFAAATADCESAEDFLEHFGIAFDRAVVHVNRLHILQRFHDYLAAIGGAADYAQHQERMRRAYQDFVQSSAQGEKVFRVFKRAAGIATVPLTAIGRGTPP